MRLTDTFGILLDTDQVRSKTDHTKRYRCVSQRQVPMLSHCYRSFVSGSAVLIKPCHAPSVTWVWTVQRQDVDNFYGSNFEADFVVLQDADLLNDDAFFHDVFTRKDLYKKFSPKILMDGQEVEHFVFTQKIPAHFTPLALQKDPGPLKLGLKMSPSDVVASVDNDWAVEVSKDVRIPAMVSAIKAAHLSLFELLGYRYALSATGEFLGRQILGKFFQQNQRNGRTQVSANARPYFKEFEHMVRPLEVINIDAQGTVTDGMLLACKNKSGSIWATIVLIKVAQQLHGVIVPLTDNLNLIHLYFEFLKNAEETLSISFCTLADDHWEVAKNQTEIIWPKSGILYPD